MSKTKARKSKIRREMEGGIKPNNKEALQEAIKKRQEVSEIDENIAHMDSRLMADFFAQKLKRHRNDLTAVEMNDLYLPTNAFLDTSAFSSIRNLDSLAAFLKEFTPGGKDTLSTTCDEKGSPHTLLVTSSGIRAADLTRALREFQSRDAMVAKLFAKHIKLDEAIKMVDKSKIGIGIGTPTRVKDLLNAGALKTANLSRLIIDGSYIDQKKRGLLDMKDLFLPLLEILRKPEFVERYGNEKQKIEILIY